MTDAEIIKAIECCKSRESGICKKCPYKNEIFTNCSCIMLSDALDLINRQKAEIERLQKHNSYAASKHYNDGVKDFAEKLKIEINELEAKSPNKAYQTAMEDMLTYYFPKIIDKCLKEAVGDEL